MKKASSILLALGLLSLSACKKKEPETLPVTNVPIPQPPVENPQSIDSTIIPPANPDFGALVATVTEAAANGNTFTRQLFYNAGGLVDSIVYSGSQNYVKRFTHTPDYTVGRFYDTGGNATGKLDSVRLNADGYPTITYNIQQDTVVWTTYENTYNANGYLETVRFNQYQPSRYGNTSSQGWSNGDLSGTYGGCGNSRCSDYYGYDATRPGMTGEPEQLNVLLSIGRPLKHSSHLRINYKNAYDTAAKPIVYKWANLRISSWQSANNTQVAINQITYYN